MRTSLRRTLEAAVLTGGFTLLGAGVAAGIAAADTGSGNSVVAPISVPITVCGQRDQRPRRRVVRLLRRLVGQRRDRLGGGSGRVGQQGHRTDHHPGHRLRPVGQRRRVGLGLRPQLGRRRRQFGSRSTASHGVASWLLVITGLLALVVGTSLTVASSRRRTG